jgi:hypothetical protein
VTPAEYVDPQRFPLTTQRGLPPRLQVGLDAGNLAWLEEFAASGGGLTELQQRRLKELLAKAAAHPPLAEQVKALREGK